MDEFSEFLDDGEWHFFFYCYENGKIDPHNGFYVRDAVRLE